MSRRVGWRLRKKRRLSGPVLLTVKKREEKPPENRYIEMKRVAAEKYIRNIGG